MHGGEEKQYKVGRIRELHKISQMEKKSLAKKEFQAKLKKVARETVGADKDGKVSKTALLKFMDAPSFSDEVKNECIDDLLKTSEFLPANEEGEMALLILGAFIYADKDKDKRISLSEAQDFIKELYTIYNLEIPADQAIKDTFQEFVKDERVGLDFENFILFYDCKEILLD